MCWLVGIAGLAAFLFFAGPQIAMVFILQNMSNRADERERAEEQFQEGLARSAQESLKAAARDGELTTEEIDAGVVKPWSVERGAEQIRVATSHRTASWSTCYVIVLPVPLGPSMTSSLDAGACATNRAERSSSTPSS